MGIEVLPNGTIEALEIAKGVVARSSIYSLEIASARLVVDKSHTLYVSGTAEIWSTGLLAPRVGLPSFPRPHPYQLCLCQAQAFQDKCYITAVRSASDLDGSIQAAACDPVGSRLGGGVIG